MLVVKELENDCIADELTRISKEGKLYDCEGTANQMESYLNSKGLQRGVDYNRVNIQTANQGFIESKSIGNISQKWVSCWN